MTAALMLLPLILAVLDEILIRQRHRPRGPACCSASSSSAVLPSSELLAIVAVVVVICVVGLVAAALVGNRDALGGGPPSRQGARRRPRGGLRAPGLAGLVPSRGRPTSRAWCGPTSG